MNEQIKTGLLGLVAVLTVVNTFMLASGPSTSDANGSGDKNGQEQASNNDKGPSNVAATRQNRNQGRDGNQGPDLQANPAQGGQQGPQAGGGNEPEGPPTTIEFEKYEHDFGEMKAGTKKTKKFSFTNTGDKPYVIQNAKGSCGCTVPSYPEEPIEPGESGEIEVNYKPGNKVSGQQTNNVTLTGNTEPPQTKLKIRANVQSAGS